MGTDRATAVCSGVETEREQGCRVRQNGNIYFGRKRKISEKISEDVKTKQQCQGCKTHFYHL